MALDETLFAGSTVLLFGRIFVGLALPTADALRGAPSALTQRAPVDPQLARIYGFSYLGTYHKLPEPTVLLVSGTGDPVPPELAEQALGVMGVEFKAETFTGGVKVWTQDRSDYSVRIDITPGWLGEILLEPGLRDGTNMTTGRSPDSGGGGSMSGRMQMTGRACMVGRGNCG